MVNEKEQKMTFTKELLINQGLNKVTRITEVGFVIETKNGDSFMITDTLIAALVAARREESKQEPAGFLYLLDDDVADSITKYEPRQWVDHTVTNVRPLYED